MKNSSFLPQHLGLARTLLKAHLRAKVTVLETQTTGPFQHKQGFLLIYPHTLSSPASLCWRPGGARNRRIPLGAFIGACHSPTSCLCRHTWGPGLKAFQTEQKKSGSSAGREVAGVWIASPRLKETLLFLPPPHFFFPSSKRLNLVNSFHIKNLSGIHIQRGCCLGLSGELLRQ